MRAHDTRKGIFALNPNDFLWKDSTELDKSQDGIVLRVDGSVWRKQERRYTAEKAYRHRARCSHKPRKTDRQSPPSYESTSGQRTAMERSLRIPVQDVHRLHPHPPYRAIGFASKYMDARAQAEQSLHQLVFPRDEGAFRHKRT